MKASFNIRAAFTLAAISLFAFSSFGMAQSAASCSEICNDVRVAVEKDPEKVLMVVEDALVINEGCAADIVKTAILASKADSVLAGQIVQTAVSVAPKMAVLINDAASSVVPGFVVAAPVEAEFRPSTELDKNPAKNPVTPAAPFSEDDFFIPTTIRGVYLIQPPASGPLPCRCEPNPCSPSVANP